jgi:hypothetical protein
MHSHPLRFVGEHMSHTAMRPLMDFLVIGGADIGVLADSAHVSDHDGLDALFIQRRDKSARGFMLDILDLMFDLSELFLLGLDQLLAPFTALMSQLIELVRLAEVNPSHLVHSLPPWPLFESESATCADLRLQNKYWFVSS